MPKNSQRRLHLLDAALQILARDGSRGLTHRAVDVEAAVPTGTCVNYFRSRDTLFDALGARIFERLSLDQATLKKEACLPPSRERLVQLMKALMTRVMAQPELQVALLELRLESARRPQLRLMLAKTLGASLALDLEFHTQAGLPGGQLEVVLLHLALEGLILNIITLPEVLNIQDQDAVIETLVLRLVP